MGTVIAFALKPLILLGFGWFIGGPVVRSVQRMKDGKLKRLLLLRISKDEWG